MVEIHSDWKRLLDALPSGIIIIDPEFNICYMNRTFTALWKIDDRQAIGKKCFDLFTGPLCHEIACPLNRISRGEDRIPYDEEQHCKCGSVSTCNVMVSALKDDAGRLTGIIESFTDASILKTTRTALVESSERLRKAMGGIIQAMSLTIEKRDPYTAGHQRRVAKLCRVIGTELGLGWECIQGLRMAAAIHDLGKINVPASILNKPGRLSEHEIAIIRQHPETAYEILKNIDFPWPITQAIHQHHERLDGSGYPRGLAGGEIILEARILAVADVAEAISSFRPYRQALGTETAMAELRNGRGVIYDPLIVDICLSLFETRGFDFNVKFFPRGSQTPHTN
ncbi:HD domain-containing phosphohydrolase [Desulfococcus sp.]|uniref:HD domain-containing phosphohydrolase n=1 Tax=Desulfococcus sp. TaxID=2025834 RepID=UPI003593E2AB